MPSHALVYAAVLGARALIYALVYAAALRTGPVFGAKQRFCRLAYQEPYQLRSGLGNGSPPVTVQSCHLSSAVHVSPRRAGNLEVFPTPENLKSTVYTTVLVVWKMTVYGNETSE